MQRRYHALQKAFLAAAAAGSAVWWWRRRPFRVAVEGASMEPALRAGEFLVAVRTGPIERETMVVIERPGRPGLELVKRVEALPGERVADRVLGPDEYWVTGDKPDASTDSRSFGPVTRSAIRGVVRFRYWPPSRLAAFR